MAKSSTVKSKVTALPAGPRPDVPDPGVVTETKPDGAASDLKKRELLQLVADRCDMNKNQVKPVVEAMMEVLGEAIAEGRELNLEPFGKLKQQRTKDTPNARVTVVKIRQKKPGAAGSAETGADSDAE
ncbi:HU family DNA-binding protein [Roseovarius aestuariivivens]|uniref:HU family DNA-binding protein n=1 Tax=Roseovarius aestuariivivens TaxID=1888910 RepID=UPI00107FD658|nr:HU family DNA-binding protein [Roseovarius aestuariivivens]